MDVLEESSCRFNRTIVGLKYKGRRYFPNPLTGFNRTIVGLKYRDVERGIRTGNWF